MVVSGGSLLKNVPSDCRRDDSAWFAAWSAIDARPLLEGRRSGSALAAMLFPAVSGILGRDDSAFRAVLGRLGERSPGTGADVAVNGWVRPEAVKSPRLSLMRLNSLCVF